MKAQILKHTGLSEKQFYAKYKTAEDFFNSKEGMAFKKAQSGITQDSNKDGIPDYLSGVSPINQQAKPVASASPDPNTFIGRGGARQAFGTGIGNMTPVPSSIAAPKLPTAPSADEIRSMTNMQRPLTAEQQQTIEANKNQQIIGAEGATPLDPTSKAVKPGKSLAEKKPGIMDKLGGIEGIAKMAGPVAGAVTSWIDEKKKAKEAKMWRGVTDVQLAASKTRPEQAERKYIRPEDQEMTGEELFPVYGVGTNPIAQGGAIIPGNPYQQGNPGEIQNTYDPYDIYMDLGYEPLNDSRIKQYQSGGIFEQIAGGIGGPASSAASTLMDNNAGFQTGKIVGDVAGKFIPIPGVDKLLGSVTGLIGGQLDKAFGPAGKIAREQKATERNIQQIGLGQQAASVQAGYASNMQSGGMLYARNWNPQMISHYGKHSMKELLKPDPMMNTLQGGGSLAHGGELQTHWGGYYEPVSRNPYLPEGGESVIFRGNSHHDSDGRGNTGIGVTYGDNPVEVEAGEPAMKLQSGGGEADMVVFGNLPINKQNAQILGDPKATNKRFKNYVSDLNKQENKYNSRLDKNTKALNDLEVYDSFDKLSMASYQANMEGSNMNLKNIADKKQKAGHLQNAINQTRDEISDALGYTISAEQLAKNGQVTKDKDPVTKMAKWGAAIEKAQVGTKKTKKGKITFKGNVGPIKYKHESINPKGLPYTKIGEDPSQTMFASDEAYADYLTKIKGAYQDPEKKRALVEYFKNYEGPGWENVRGSINKGKTFEEQAAIAEKLGTDRLPGPFHINPEQFDIPVDTPPAETPAEDVPLEEKKENWWDLIGAALPYIRPSNAGVLDPNQLMGEMYAMSSNQVDPVQAQGYQPQLRVPYDISLQDQLNQVTSQTRAAQRMAGYNPAAQAAIAGQAYAPANQILGDQFRQNQAMKDQVYSGNIATLNDAKARNLGIFDQQAQRQSQAVSNTKAINQAALNSISSKYQQNALENKTLQTYENLYNYRYGPGMRAINMNPLYQPNMPTVWTGDEKVDPNAIAAYSKAIAEQDKLKKDKETKAEKEAKKDTTAKRNGSIVSALKRM